MTVGILITFLILFGLAAGSFLNSFVWRYGRLRPHPTRSVCVHCKKPIRNRDLIPLASFLFLGGRCRFCHGRIPWHYPVVEGVTASLFLLLLVAFGPSGVLLPAVALTFFLEALFLLDLRYSVLPDSISVPAMLAAFLLSIFLGRTATDVALGVALGAGVFLLQYIFSRGKWIGDGDIRLGAVMGLALGWQLTILALLIAYWSGALVGIALLANGKKTMSSSLPFGTFLTTATFAVLLLGEWLLHIVQRPWYL